MINLLPETYKKELVAARQNVLLLRYNFFLLGVGGFLMLACLSVFALLTTTKAIAEATSTTNDSKVQDYAKTIKDADEYRKNLETAKKILANDISYTKLALDITALLPKGVILDGLNLDAKTFGTQTTIMAHAKDYAAVTALKSAFEKSSLFTNVHLQSITADDKDEKNAYPLGVGMNVTVKKATPQ